jgi:hypothetical protein
LLSGRSACCAVASHSVVIAVAAYYDGLQIGIVTGLSVVNVPSFATKTVNKPL